MVHRTDGKNVMKKIYSILLLFLFLLPGEVLAQCVSSISFNTNVSGNWESSCTSANSSGSYAKYYTFTLSSSQQVTIDLQSLVDTYLFLLNGSGQTGSVIDEDDDDGSGTDSQIIRTLSAGTYTVEATTYDAEVTGNFVVSVRVSTPPCSDCPFLINAGLNDAWYYTGTNGQGFLIAVLPDAKLMFVAWFTYDTERPPEDVTALLGEPGHRWLTAQGPYDGDTANLTIFMTEGGVFDAAEPVPSTDPAGYGTMILEFADCAAGLVIYEITSLGISGEIPIQRIVPDNVPLCESLVEQLHQDP
jgi:hypothetical protein